jgi:hypothetical protein
MIQVEFKDSVICHPLNLFNAFFYNKLHYHGIQGDFKDYCLLGHIVKSGR